MLSLTTLSILVFFGGSLFTSPALSIRRLAAFPTKNGTMAFTNKPARYTFRTIVSLLPDDVGKNFTYLTAINSAGVLVGRAQADSLTISHSFVAVPPYGKGNFKKENFPGAIRTVLKAINSKNHTCGYYAKLDHRANAIGYVRVGDNKFISFSHPKVSRILNSTRFVGINDEGVVVGSYRTNLGSSPFLWDYNSRKLLPIPQATGRFKWTASSIASINNKGAFTGDASVTGETYTKSYLFTKEYALFMAPGALSTSLSFVNNADQVVGSYNTDTAAFLAYVGKVSGSHITFQQLLAPASLGMRTTWTCVNDRGILAGYAWDEDPPTGDVTRSVGLLAMVQRT